jgi:predicted transcriptional regulator
MARRLSQVIRDLPAAQRRAVEERARVLIAEEMSLRDLRKALQLTQVEIAKRLKKGQDEISRIENRDDVLLSTLQSYIASMGGELEVICRFKNRPPVRVTATDRASKSAKKRER